MLCDPSFCSVAFNCRISTNSVKASIYSIALYKKTLSLSAVGRHSQPDARRADMLISCLQSTKQWYTDVFSQPAVTFFSMLSFPMFVQLSYFIFSLYRLSSFKDDDSGEFRCGWDRHLARQHLDISGTLDAVAGRFAECPEVAGYVTDHPDGDVLMRWRRLCISSSQRGWRLGQRRMDVLIIRGKTNGSLRRCNLLEMVRRMCPSTSYLG